MRVRITSFSARACVLQHLGDDLEDGARLRRGIADRDGFAARARGRAADGDDIADAHRAREADDRLVRAPGRHKKSLSVAMSFMRLCSTSR